MSTFLIVYLSVLYLVLSAMAGYASEGGGPRGKKDRVVGLEG